MKACGMTACLLNSWLIHDPDFVMKIKENDQHISLCNQCNICVAEMDRGGVRCVLTDPSPPAGGSG
jgi:hypothetical protein